MIAVYICAPYRASTDALVAFNCERATALAAVALRLGLAPVLPHAHAAAYILAARMGGDADEKALGSGLAQLAAVKAAGGRLWILTGDRGDLSAGCHAEWMAWGGMEADGWIAANWAGWRQPFWEAAMALEWERLAVPTGGTK